MQWRNVLSWLDDHKAKTSAAELIKQIQYQKDDDWLHYYWTTLFHKKTICVYKLILIRALGGLDEIIVKILYWQKLHQQYRSKTSSNFEKGLIMGSGSKTMSFWKY